jgi:hypothetical protein
LAYQTFIYVSRAAPESTFEIRLGPGPHAGCPFTTKTGQKEDIADYVRSVVYSNLDTNMKRRKMEDKELTVKTLVEQADGMYVICFTFAILVFMLSNRSRWVFYLLEVLRDCLSAYIQISRNYQNHWMRHRRVLREIKRSNRDHTRRLLKCLLWPSGHSASRSSQRSSLSTSKMRRRPRSCQWDD